MYRITYNNAKSSFEILRSFTGDGYGSYDDNDDDDDDDDDNNNNIIKITRTVTVPATEVVRTKKNSKHGDAANLRGYRAYEVIFTER